MMTLPRANYPDFILKMGAAYPYPYKGEGEGGGGSAYATPHRPHFRYFSSM